MAQSKHWAIGAAVKALMEAGTPVAQQIFQNRDFRLAEGVDSQLHVDVPGAKATDITLFTGNPRDWLTEIELTVLTRKVGVVEAAEAADAIWVEVYSRLMADQQLGGLVDDLQPGDMTSLPDQADSSFCKLTWRLSAIHRTDNNSIT